MGKIVIVSSHILPELSDFCNCVGIIEKGNLLAFGDVASVVRSIRPTKLVRVHCISDMARLEEMLANVKNVQKCETVGKGELLIELMGDELDQANFLKAMVDGGHQIVNFSEDQANLEDVFLKLTTGAVN